MSATAKSQARPAANSATTRILLDDIDASGNHTPEASGAERLLTQAIQDARAAVLDGLKKLE